MPDPNPTKEERKEERRKAGEARWPFGHRAASANGEPPAGEAAAPDLTPWDKVQLARHPQRPHTLDYIRGLCEDFVELHGDRRFGDDAAMIGGLARFNGQAVMVVGHQKGRDARDNVKHNWGMPRPEGYRKA